MRFVTFHSNGRNVIGVLQPATDEIMDLSIVAPDLPAVMEDLVALGDEGIKIAREACQSAHKGAIRSAQSVKIMAPFPTPRRNVMCVGKNYREHAEEFHNSGFDAAGKSAVPEYPIIFTKMPSSVIGPNDPIPSKNDSTNSVDYEGELVFVIGKPGRDIAKADAMNHVYGYTIINDVTARTQQHKYNQWFLGKSLDGFCPMGPALVTADEVGDVSEIRLLTKVNGEVRQDAAVSDLIFDIPTLIETMSEGRTLQSGDLIATGTSVGVGLGFTPPKFLKPGDVVEITFDRVGTLINPVE